MGIFSDGGSYEQIAAERSREWTAVPPRHEIEIARKQGFNEGYAAGQHDAEHTPTELDMKMVERSQRLACLKIASRLEGQGMAQQVINDAQDYFNWVTMTDEERAAPAAQPAQP